MANLSNAPTIIKRKKVVAGGGHHGGAWKVAYADFVTAMMAFFMLMWLLNATTETQRQGLADYFSPTVPLSMRSGGGAQVLNGNDALSTDITAGSAPASTRPEAPDGGLAERGIDDGKPEALSPSLAEIEEALTGASGESMVADELLRHIVTRVTDQGLIVDIFDLPDAPLFWEGAARPTPLMIELTGVVSEIFALARNEIAINGHVRSVPIVIRETPIWDLSVARAQAVRNLITRGAVDEARVQRIGGFADREPTQSDPMDVRNNRIELILLR